MTLNGVMAVILRYYTEFGIHTFHHNRRDDLWRNLCTSLLYSIVHVRCRRKESSRSLSHLLMSFLFVVGDEAYHNVAGLTSSSSTSNIISGWTSVACSHASLVACMCRLIGRWPLADWRGRRRLTWLLNFLYEFNSTVYH